MSAHRPTVITGAFWSKSFLRTAAWEKRLVAGLSRTEANTKESLSDLSHISPGRGWSFWHQKHVSVHYLVNTTALWSLAREYQRNFCQFIPDIKWNETAFDWWCKPEHSTWNATRYYIVNIQYSLTADTFSHSVSLQVSSWDWDLVNPGKKCRHRTLTKYGFRNDLKVLKLLDPY